MEEKKNSKISLLTYILILIAIVIAIVVIVILVVNNENDRAQENDVNNNNLDNQITNSQNISALNVDGELIDELYEYITKFNYYEELLVYQTNGVTVSDLSNQLKLLTIFNNLYDDDATRTYTETEQIDGESYENEHIIYSQEVVENKGKEIFGDDLILTHESAYPYDGYAIEYENGEYNCYIYENNYESKPWSNSIYSIVNVEQDADGNIYIYDKYLHLVNLDENANLEVEMFAGTYDIYSASDRNTLLASNVNFSSLSGDILEDAGLLIEEIENSLGINATTYKHTFRKNSNGEYYWYSTEPVE